ncbi:helix-turn-helix DNA binding domain protein [Gordonia phage DirtyBoi]|nr:helix-turn-helix DNA binding domain protein [Gordonia phage DirtyBoi]
MSPTTEQRAAAAERRDLVAELTRAGLTASQISDRLGITTRTVQRHRVAAGIAQPPARHLTPEQIDTARQLIDDGASYKEAARTIGCNKVTVAKRFPGRGWTLAECGRWGRFLDKTRERSA